MPEFLTAPVGVRPLGFLAGPVFAPAVAGVRALAFAPGRTEPAELVREAGELEGRMIVLARRSEFSPATGDPEKWRPAAGYGWGTVRLGRELGVGELVTCRRVAQGAPDTTQTGTGRNAFGDVADWSEVLECGCVVSLIGPDDEPEVGDVFTVEGRTYVCFFVDVVSAVGSERYLTLRAVRWNGLTVKRRVEADFEIPTMVEV